MENNSLLKKWGDSVSPKVYKDIKNEYDAMQVARLLENTYKKNFKEIKNDVSSVKMLTEAGENYVPINGMQPSLLLPLMRRMYPKIIMQNFVSVQTLPTPNAVIHYLKRIFKSSKNGVTEGQEFTGLPSEYDVYGAFNPFFSSEMIKSTTIANNGTEVKQLKLSPADVTFYDEKGEQKTITITPNTIGEFVRRIVIPVHFYHTHGRLNGWLIRGRNEAGYTGGINWKFTFFPVKRYDDGTAISSTPLSNDFSFEASGSDMIVTYGGTAFTEMHAGWVDGAAETDPMADTEYGYYSIDARKFPKIMPEMGIEINTIPITTVDRTFKIRYNPKEEKIFEDYLNFNLATELVNEISDQMAYEIDREIKQYLETIIIEDLREFVAVDDYKVTTTGGTFYDPMLYLMFKIELFSAKMEAINKMGRPNQILVSPRIAAMLNHLTTFKFYDDNVSHPAGGVYKIGSIPSKFDFYVDPQATSDTILLAHKHEGSPFGAGVVYAPYFSFLTPEIWDGDNGGKTRILTMTYGLEKVPFGEYLYGAMHVSGISNI